MPSPDIINLIEHRFARMIAPMRDMMLEYREATLQAAEWTAAADKLWDELVDNLKSMIALLPSSDPEAFDALRRWYAQSNGMFNLPTLPEDKLVELLARGIVGMLATLVTSDDLLEDEP